MFPPRRGSSTSDSSSMSSSSSEYSKASVPISVPSLEDSRLDTPAESFFDSPRESADTYCTTLASYDDDEEDDVYDSFYSSIPEAVPATPQEFAELFPTTERLSIKHDDSTLDGNMNLRVDCGPRSRRITLFHLRMYDLRDRDFSVRRYGRDCGREVAHVKRKCTAPRPSLQRSVSKALQSFRGKSEDPVRRLDRVDSGYKSHDEEDLEEPNSASTKSTNTCVLEFSNYAHVDLARRGNRSSKKYDFEYWGKSYSWRRTLLSEEAAYTLVNNATGNIIATIRPEPLTPAMAAAEEAKGGFVPPCTMQIRHSVADPITSANADVADVIMTTGLVMLVDDCIKRKYHTKKTVQLVLPTTGFKMDMEYVGPKRFLGEMFTRSRPTTPAGPRRANTA